METMKLILEMLSMGCLIVLAAIGLVILMYSFIAVVSAAIKSLK